MSEQIQSGQQVQVHYKGTLADGSVFDSSEGREPLSFQVGAGQVIPGFDEAIVQMSVGEIKTITIPSDQAYGPVNDEMIAVIPKDQFPEDLEFSEGGTLNLSTSQGDILVTVVEINDEGVKVDGNHPLAGKDLTFELNIVSAE